MIPLLETSCWPLRRRRPMVQACQSRDVRRLFVAVLVVRAVTLAQAVDERNRVEALLSAPSLAERAWGAYWAGQLHDDSLDKLLIARLSEAQGLSQSGDSPEEHAYVLALFDALIQSGQRVPEKDLISFKEARRDEVLILLARDRGNEDLLLSMREEKLNQPQWLTVNNLLLRMKSAQFYTKTLNELRITHEFTVVDPVGLAPGSGGGSGGGGWSCGVRGLPKGFPPIGLYQLTEYAGEGYVLVAKGPRDIYYRRKVVPTDRQIGWDVPFSMSDRQWERLQYLAALNQFAEAEVMSIFWAQSSVPWHNAADFLRRTDADLEAQAANIQAFVAAARLRGIMVPSGISLKIVPKVKDLRRSIPGSLPEVAPEGFVVQ